MNTGASTYIFGVSLTEKPVEKFDREISDSIYQNLHYCVRPLKYRRNNYSMSTKNEDKKSYDSMDISKITAEFQCFVCGAIFTTDEDLRQHLEKEAHGQLHEDETPEDMEIANKEEELNESRHHHNRKNNTSYGEKKEEQEMQVEQPNKIDWQKTIGKTVRSKDNLNMGTVIVDDDKDYRNSYSVTIEYGDHERFSIPKETIYKTDKQNLYTTLTENEIIASRKDDPFSTSVRSYTRD